MSYSVYDDRADVQPSLNIGAIFYESYVLIYCIISNCEKILGSYEIYIKMNNLINDAFWFDIDASGGTKFEI